MCTLVKSLERITILLFIVFAILGAQTGFCEDPPTVTAKVALDGGGGGSAGSAETALPDLFTGSMSYQIPIEVPPGRNGMEPGLALTYRSSNGIGWLGMGWELEVGAIERSTKHGVNYTNNEFLLRRAGSLSELVSTPNDALTYRQKIESDFTVINQVTATGSFSDRYFIATTKTGMKFYFGQTEDSCLYGPQGVFKWSLSSIVDPNGNSVSFTYARENGQIYLDHVDYNGNRINFYREDRDDKPDMFTTNFLVKTSKRLSQIDVLGADGSRVRAYNLNYTYSLATGRSLLSSVKQFGRDTASDSLSQEVTFSYTEPSSTLNDPSKWLDSSGPGGQTYSLGYQFAGDFDGDGRTDYMYKAGSNWYVAHSNGDGFDTPVLWSGGDTSWPSGPLNNESLYQFIGDFNGDGKIDYMYLTSNDGWYVALSAGHGFYTPTKWLSLTYDGGSTAWDASSTFMLLGDFDGDGKTDYMYTNAAGRWYVARSNGAGFNNPVRWSNDSWPNSSFSDYVNGFTGDFNGDGKTDYMYVKNGVCYVALSNGSGFDQLTPWRSNLNINTYNILYVGDFNGDGKTDVMYQGSDGWYVALSNGSGFEAPAKWLDISVPSGNTYGGSSSYMFVGDFNGDGKTDYVYNNGGWYIALSNGSGFNTPTLWLASSDANGPTSNKGYQIIGDFTGDGKIDYMYSYNGWHVAKNDSPADLLTSITNNFGSTTTVSYTSSTQYGNLNPLLPLSLQVVSSIKVDDGNGIVSESTYSYSGGFYYIPERDFRGFNHVVAKGPVGPSGEQKVTETWFHQGNASNVAVNDVDVDNPNVAIGYMKGKPYRVRITDGSGNTYSETETIYGSKQTLTAPWYFNPPARVDTYICDGNVKGACKGTANAVYLKTVYLYDADYQNVGEYGNLSYEYHYGNVDDDSDDFTIARTYSPNSSTGIVGLASSETIYAGIGTTTKVASTSYYYDDAVNCFTPSERQTPLQGRLTRIKKWLKYDNEPDKYLETRMAYDTFGNLVCSRDARANATTATTINPVTTGYDSSNTFPIIATNPLGQSATVQYYGVDNTLSDFGLYGQKKVEYDPNGASTSYTYDTLGRPLSTTGPDNFLTQWQYIDAGAQYGKRQVTTITSDGLWSKNYLDGLNRSIRSERKGPDSNNPLSFALVGYDTQGNQFTQTLPAFQSEQANAVPATKAYDAMGRVTQLTSPDRKVTRYCYDRTVTVTVDPNNHRRREVHDAYGRLTKVQEYKGTFASCTTEEGAPYATTAYTYDVLGNLRFVIDAKGNQTEMRYDTLGRKRYMNDPDMGAWTYDYDENGNLKTQIDAKKQTIAFTYDELDRLKTKHYPTGQDVVLTYDVPDDPSASTSINAKGRLTKMTDSSGQTVYNYDRAGRISNTIKTIDGTSYTLAYSYLNGHLSRITYPDNDYVDYGYDPAGNLLTVGNYVTYSTFDALGRPKATAYENANVLGNAGVAFFTYDGISKRLTNLTVSSQALGQLINNDYGYDNKGNIASITDKLNKVLPTDFSSESYVLASNRAHAIDSTGSGRTFLYDDNGNIYNDGRRKYSYNFDNMPLTVNDVSFTYDGNGTRVKKSYGGVTTVYIDKLYECINGNCSKYIYAGNTRIAIKDSTGTFYYHLDHQGSTSAVTDASGNKREELAYFPFGETRQQSGNVSVPHKYTGQEYDSENGLYNYNARLYDPELGRFLTPDNVVADPNNPQGFNRYSYVGNNPINNTDPSGHCPECIAAAILGGIFGAVTSGVSSDWQWDKTLIGAGIGAASGYVGGYIGVQAAAAGGGGAAGAISGSVAGGAVSGATSGGLNAAVNGGNVLEGIALGEIIGAESSGFTTALSQVGVPNFLTSAAFGYMTGGRNGALFSAASVVLSNATEPLAWDRFPASEDDYKAFMLSQPKNSVYITVDNPMGYIMQALGVGNHIATSADADGAYGGLYKRLGSDVGFDPKAPYMPGQKAAQGFSHDYSIWSHSCSSRFNYFTPQAYFSSVQYRQNYFWYK